MSDKEIYQLIADELKNNNIDAAVWTQAKETAEGDKDKTEAAYIRLRFLDLVKSARPPQQSNSLTNNPGTGTGIKPKDNELSRMRTELAKKVLVQQKHSLYSTLKLQPDASDAVIATAISELENGNLAGSGINPAEFNYAKNTLGNPDLREQYDRQLLASVSNSLSITRPYQTYASGEMYSNDSWWESSKTSVIIGVLSLTLFGYLGLNFLKERNGSKIQTEVVQTLKENAQTTSETEKMRVQADIDARNEALRLQAERQRVDLDYRSRATDQMLDQQRRAQESRAQAEQQRLKMQQDQAANMAAARERQYWACVNQQMNQRDPNGIEASSRCSMYR